MGVRGLAWECQRRRQSDLELRTSGLLHARVLLVNLELSAGMLVHVGVGGRTQLVHSELSANSFVDVAVESGRSSTYS
jgi:hypothetical protein